VRYNVVDMNTSGKQ